MSVVVQGKKVRTSCDVDSLKWLTTGQKPHDQDQ